MPIATFFHDFVEIKSLRQFVKGTSILRLSKLGHNHYIRIRRANLEENVTTSRSLSWFDIPKISSMAVPRVVESSSSSVITLDPAKSANSEAFFS